MVIHASAIQVRKELMKNQRKEILVNHKSIIFMDYQKVAHEYFSPDQIMSLKYKMTLVFRDFLKYKIWKYEKHKDLDYSCMALGERVCLNLAFLVAIKQFEIDIQIDININPLDFIDSELRKGVSESLDYRRLVLTRVDT
tara:strand:- start:553 stop:972 length:420 start_codon:yes stop_codon:yes gene_type:complete